MNVVNPKCPMHVTQSVMWCQKTLKALDSVILEEHYHLFNLCDGEIQISCNIWYSCSEGQRLIRTSVIVFVYINEMELMDIEVMIFFLTNESFVAWKELFMFSLCVSVSPQGAPGSSHNL